MTTSASEKIGHIGQRIRALRKERGQTLQALGEQVSLSASYLSQIENGRVELNISNLKAISDALEVPLVALFVEEEGARGSVMRAAERHWYDLGEIGKEAPLIKTGGSLEIFSIRLFPHTPPTEENRHQGEEVSYVLRGRIRIYLGGDSSHDLGPGDSIHYQSDIPHRWQNVGEEEAEVLVVNTPATF